jgi:replicative DNA helicase
MAEDFLARVPPHSIDSEMGLLGSILLDSNAILEAIELGVVSDDFYHEYHRILFKAMLELTECHKPVDVILLAEQLGGKDQLERVGGARYLAELAAYVPTAAHVRHYSTTVKSKATLRNLIAVMGRLTEDAYDASGGDDISELLDHVASEILNACHDRKSSSRAKALSTALPETYRQLEQMWDAGTSLGIPSGLRDLDAATGGLEPENMIVIAGRPGKGKTALMTELCRKFAEGIGQAVVIFSLEMSMKEIHLRLICAKAQSNLWLLRRSRSSASEKERMRFARSSLCELPIIIDDTAAITPMGMRSSLRQIQHALGKTEIGLIAVDYLQLMQPSKRHQNETSAVTEISQALKSIAKDFHCPVLALSQLNRELEQREDKRPRLSDLRSSGAIEQDADVVLMLHSHKTEETVLEVMVEKQRNGPKTNFQLFLHRESLRVEDLETSSLH